MASRCSHRCPRRASLRVAIGLALAGLMPGAACQTTTAATTGSAGSGSGSSTGTDTTATAGATTVGTPDECQSSEDCAGTTGGPDLMCVASYDPGLGVKGPAVCSAECIAENDLTRWCQDDAGCCEGLFCREVDGFCEPPSTTSTSTGTGSSGSGSDTGTSTGG